MDHFPVRRSVVSAAIVFGALGLGGDAGAQAADTTIACVGEIVKTVDVRTNRPTFRGALGWWRRAARAIGLHHETTAEGLVRRFVSLDPGKPCTEFRRSESERILRAQPYLADASVLTSRSGDSVHVDVSTVDEMPVVGGARLRGARVEAFSLGTMNFAGAGMHVEGRWENSRFYRQGFGGKLAHSQLFGRPYALLLEGARHPIGEVYSAGLSHPFLTDLQRVAWHSGYVISKDFAHLRKPDRQHLVQPVDRSIWNLGGVVRVGPPRRLWLVGAVLLSEHLVVRHDFSTVDTITGRLLPTTDTAGVRRYPGFDATSAAAVVGLRALTFSRMRGLDAIEAEQDVATGTQIGTLLGSVPFSGFLLRDGFASVDAYIGGRTRRNFVAARAEAESRLDLERRDWNHLIASGRAAWYFKPRPRWTSELSIEGAGGWRPLFPFQIELGDRRGGLRGYARSLEAGAQRVIARFEQRADLARYQRTRAAIGGAVFTDAGRMWGGEVPFGRDTPIRTSVGAAILAAIPARSQRTIRAELAVPMSRMHGAKPELRFVVREPARGFWSDPPRIRWARLAAVPEQIFSWP
jgi:hypothetical protein